MPVLTESKESDFAVIVTNKYMVNMIVVEHSEFLMETALAEYLRNNKILHIY